MRNELLLGTALILSAGVEEAAAQNVYSTPYLTLQQRDYQYDLGTGVFSSVAGQLAGTNAIAGITLGGPLRYNVTKITSGSGTVTGGTSGGVLLLESGTTSTQITIPGGVQVGQQQCVANYTSSSVTITSTSGSLYLKTTTGSTTSTLTTGATECLVSDGTSYYQIN